MLPLNFRKTKDMRDYSFMIELSRVARDGEPVDGLEVTKVVHRSREFDEDVVPPVMIIKAVGVDIVIR